MHPDNLVDAVFRVANVTTVGGRTKVLFQEPLSHAAVGTWIKSGDLRWVGQHRNSSTTLTSCIRYVVVNNLAVLDTPGEYVCTEHQGLVTFSWIPPAGRTAVSLYSIQCHATPTCRDGAWPDSGDVQVGDPGADVG